MSSVRCRSPALGTRGMVASDQPLATAAALEMLAAGGTAADAAVAADAVLGVVQPMSTGLGGDATFLVAHGNRVDAYQGTGAVGQALDPEPLMAAGRLADDDPRLIVVPGVVDAWARLLDGHGRLGLDRALQPAIRLAHDGAPVLPMAARSWARFGTALRHAGAVATFLPGGRPPVALQRFANPALGATLERLAAKGAHAFYTGELAEATVRTVQDVGGVLTVDDLEVHRGTDAEPVDLDVDGQRLVEVGPPNGGVIVLLAMALLARATGGADRVGDEVDRVDLQIRAVERAFEAAFAAVGDPRSPGAGAVGDLVGPGAVARLELELRTRPAASRQDRRGGTVVIVVADNDGRMVSWASSLFQGFGSGICGANLGFCLNDRGLGFTPQAGHPNAPGPGKRPYHTVMPAMLLRGDGAPAAAFGFAGADMQPQAQVQLLGRLLLDRMDPQAALDSPRWHTSGGGHIEVEDGWPAALLSVLADRGHVVDLADGAVFGRGEVVVARDDGWLVGGSDTRGDGLAAGW
jgi:gamma-glutamyltranspeptidase / glutathione hydrolase